jgi:iron complex outermembrane recepter protein
MKRRVLAGLACCALSSAMALADDSAPTQTFQIPPADLIASLELLAKQSGIEFIYDADQLEGIQAHGVSGEWTPRAALMKLLEGTHLIVTEHNGALLIATPAGGQSRTATSNAARQVQTTSDLPSPALNEAGAVTADRSSRNASLDEIIVTGTHIRGAAPVGSALIVYTRTDIEQSGSATLDQFARTMTANFASVDTISNPSSNIRFSAAAASNGSNAFQGAAFNLHGLGPSTTLTLLNGQRLAPGGLDGSFTDISLIPLSAVDHVEVLPDGASAIYGADAVSGAVNIITRTNFSGAETTVRYGGSTEGGADEATVSQLFGKTWTTGNVIADYEFDDQHGLSASQRDYIPNLGAPYSLIPANRRNSIFIGGSQELAAKTTISSDVLYSDRRFSDAGTFGSLADLATQSTVASGSAREVSATATLDRAWIGDWHSLLTGNYSRNEQVSATTAALQGSTGQSQVLIQGATPSLVDVDALLQGSFATIPGGSVKGAFGASARMERYESTDLKAALGRTTSDGEPLSRREVASIYGEIVAPVIGEANAAPGYRRLDLSVAGRLDHYSDFGTTINPKIGLSWQFNQDLSAKGTFGSSFRAPLLSQIHAPLAFETQLFPNKASANGTTDAIVIQGGNLNLLPEKSKSYTVGFDFKPVRAGYALSLNLFYVRLTSTITTPPTSFGGNVSLSDRVLVPFVTHDPSLAAVLGYFDSPGFSGDLTGLGPAGVQAIFDDRFTNLAATVESGVDFSSQYALLLGASRLEFSLALERLIENDNRAVYFVPVVSLLNSLAEPPKCKGRATAAWSEGPVTATAAVNYVNSYRNSLFIPPQSIGSWTTGDLNISYRTRQSERNWTIAISIANLTDAHPPRVQIPASSTGDSAIPFDPANASPVGRMVSLSVVKRW